MIHDLYKQQHGTQWVSQPLLCPPDACCPLAPWLHPSCSPPATVTPTKDSATLGLCPATWLCHLYWGQLPLGPSSVAWCRRCSRRAPSWPQALLLEGPALTYSGVNPPELLLALLPPLCQLSPSPWTLGTLGCWWYGFIAQLSQALLLPMYRAGPGWAHPLSSPPDTMAAKLRGNAAWKCCVVEMLHVRNTARYDCCME